MRNIAVGDAKHRATLRRHLEQLFCGTHQVSLYTDAGILSNSGFFTTLWRRAMHRMLPEVPDAARLKNCFDCVFQHSDDHVRMERLRKVPASFLVPPPAEAVPPRA